jgi:hypothetical protein
VASVYTNCETAVVAGRQLDEARGVIRTINPGPSKERHA